MGTLADLSQRLRVYTLWTLAVPAFYVATGYVPLSRYLILITPTLVLLCAMMVDCLSREHIVVKRYTKQLVLVSAVVAVLLSCAVTLWRILPASTGKREAAYKVLGTWLQRHTPEGTKIAAAEIGAIGFYSRRYIVDLNGLIVPPDQVRFVLKRDILGLLVTTRPEYSISKHVVKGVNYDVVMSVASVSHRARRPPKSETIVLYTLAWPEKTDLEGAHADR